MSRAVFQSTLGGSTTLDAEQTADTKTLVIPAADGTLVYTDDTGVTSFDNISLTGAVIAGAWDGDTIDVAHGGTGAVTLTGYVKGNGTSAMTASATVPSTDITGLGTMSVQNANNVAITGGTISDLGTALAVPSGGTGATTLTGYVKGAGTSAMTASATIPNTDITGLGTAAEKDVGVANGVASLDAGGKVPVSELPAAVLGALNYQGTWNASTNTPTLASGVGDKGYYYVVSVAGSTNLDGVTDWQIGDWAVYNGTAWQKVDNSDAGGDVVGPASATDNAIARYDTTTGKLLQNSLVIIDDTGSVTGVNALTAESLTVNNNATLGSSNTDTLDVNARITTDLEPNANNAKDIGTSGRNWRDGFFGRDLSTVNLVVTGTTSYDGAQGTSGQVLTSAGTGNTPTWTTPTTGTVTSVGGTGTVNGITLSGTVTSSGNLTLGGTLSGVNLTTQVTGTLPVANGGTGITSFGAGVATFLGTPTSANLAAAVTDETGTGALVFGTSPTLTTPTITGGTVNPTTLQENGSPVVVQTDIGTAPNEIPLNQYLGNLAYQDAANIAGDVGVGGALTVVGQTFVNKITASTGILFGTDTAAANTLDDYEEGTFTATLTATTTAPTTPVTATAYYTKIGRQVNIIGAFQNVSTVGAVGNILVTGLPYTYTTASGITVVGAVSTFALADNTTTKPTIQLANGATQFTLREVAAGTTVPIIATTGTFLFFNFTYFV
jgi:hypothetical protein